jgi:hypothetical protein
MMAAPGTRTRRAGLVGVALTTAALAMAACSSSTSTAPAASTTSTAPAPSTTETTSAPSTTATTATTGAVNVAVSDQTRSQLVAAGAAVNGIPVAQYSGLAPGLTYEALDRTTGTYWAGARLVPAPSSDPSNPTRAQVASQDDGSYYVFRRSPGGSWTAFASGASGGQSPCPVSVPAAVVAVWGWPAGSCRPPGA